MPDAIVVLRDLQILFIAVHDFVLDDEMGIPNDYPVVSDDYLKRPS